MAEGHSESFFGDYRDFWWNDDFLNQMAQRLSLVQHHSVLDVGCGQCHWTKIIASLIGRPATITGIDNEPKWVSGKNKLDKDFQQLGIEKFELIEGSAEKLPFDNESFDLVTCQTLLIHLKKPAKALKEMKRVLKPGGTVLCVEPNNMTQQLMKSSTSSDDPIDTVLDHVKFALICERGKKKLGQGDNSLGDLVPGMLAKTGFEDIKVRLSDKTIPMYPPYEKEEQVATLQQWASGSNWKSEKYGELEYFEAFGNRYMDFYQSYKEKYARAGEQFIDDIASKKYHSAGGALLYVISGKKPL